MFRKILSTIAVVVVAAFTLNACTQYAQQQQVSQTKQESREYKKKYTKSHYVSSSAIEEYVNRVAKKIILVSDKPNTKMQFKVSGANTPYLHVRQHGTVEVSYGFLRELDNEAELAAVLSNSIAEIYHNLDNTTKTSDAQAAKIDSTGLEYMYRAGYDPLALVELQERYVSESPHYNNHWLNNVYAANPPTSARITANKNHAKKLPQGLMRGAERYRQHIGA